MAKFQNGSRVIREDTQRKGVVSQVFDAIRSEMQGQILSHPTSEQDSAR